MGFSFKSVLASIYAKGNKNFDLKKSVEESFDKMQDKHSAFTLGKGKLYFGILGTIASVGSVFSGIAYFNFFFTEDPDPLAWITLVSLVFLILLEGFKKETMSEAWLGFLRSPEYLRPHTKINLFFAVISVFASVFTSLQGVKLYFAMQQNEISLAETGIKDVVNIDSVNQIHDIKIKNLQQKSDELNETAKNLSKNWNPQASKYTDMVLNVQNEIATEEIRRNAAVREAKQKNEAFRAKNTNILLAKKEESGRNVWLVTAFCEIFSLFQILFDGLYHYYSTKDQVSVQPELLDVANEVVYIDVSGERHRRELDKFENRLEQLEQGKTRLLNEADDDPQKKTS